MQLLLPTCDPVATLAKPKRPKQLSLTRATLSPLLRFDQIDYCSATAWIAWVNPYREARELPKKRFVDFRRFIGQSKIDEFEAFLNQSIGESCSPIKVELFRSGSNRHLGTWIPRMVMPDFLAWLSDGIEQPLAMFWNSGRWSRWESRVFTRPDNSIIPKASDEIQEQATAQYQQLCDALKAWRDMNPGASSCSEGMFYNVYAGYLVKGVFEVNLNQLKKLLLLKTGQSIHTHLPEVYLVPLMMAYEQAAQALTPDMNKADLKQSLTDCGKGFSLTDSDRGLLLAA